MSGSRRTRAPKPPPQQPAGKKPDSWASGSKRTRCDICPGCIAPECGVCNECRRKSKFGGDGSSRKACDDRLCYVIHGDPRRGRANTATAKAHSASTLSFDNSKNAPEYDIGPPPSLLDDTHLTKKQKLDEAPVVDSMYGQKIQDDPGDTQCAGCMRPQEDVNDAVLLCDGPGCSREYHLRCCDPPLDEIPTGDWFCQDCSKNGTSAQLMMYLELHDEEKANYPTSAAYVKSLIQSDMRDYGRQRTKEGDANPTVREPVSELGRASELYAAIKNDVPDEMSGPPDNFIGKPFRIYDRLSNDYHSGRFVDCRYIKSRDALEFLARFPAGKDGRKTPVLHWIVPEEHSLAIEFTLVWLHEGKRFVPGQFYVRTARELVAVQHLYSEERGQIRFEPKSGVYTPQKEKKWGLVRLLGSEVFMFLDLEIEVQLYGLPEYAKYGENADLKIPVGLAEVERLEQEDTEGWAVLHRGNSWASFVLFSSDQHCLPQLLAAPLPEYPSNLVTSIPQGLDRLHILKHLRRQGAAVSKGVGASISCSEVSVQDGLRRIDAGQA